MRKKKLLKPQFHQVVSAKKSCFLKRPLGFWKNWSQASRNLETTPPQPCLAFARKAKHPMCWFVPDGLIWLHTKTHQNLSIFGGGGGSILKVSGGHFAMNNPIWVDIYLEDAMLADRIQKIGILVARKISNSTLWVDEHSLYPNNWSLDL